MSVLDWNQKDKVELRDWLVGFLGEGVLVITFKKRDGSERVMKCTLRGDMVVPYERKTSSADKPYERNSAHERKTERTRVVNENTLSVWDVDVGDWRSFNLDSIIKIEGSLLG